VTYQSQRSCNPADPKPPPGTFRRTDPTASQRTNHPRHTHRSQPEWLRALRSLIAVSATQSCTWRAKPHENGALSAILPQPAGLVRDAGPPANARSNVLERTRRTETTQCNGWSHNVNLGVAMPCPEPPDRKIAERPRSASRRQQLAEPVFTLVWRPQGRVAAWKSALAQPLTRSLCDGCASQAPRGTEDTDRQTLVAACTRSRIRQACDAPPARGPGTATRRPHRAPGASTPAP